MKKSRQGIKRIGKYLIALVTFALFFSLSAAADGSADTAYEFDAVIKRFPESYRPYLEELHEKHPQWVFLPFETGLDWYETIDAQYGDEALVQHSITADVLKSHDKDDYNPASGSFVYKDGGFVQASELAVEYFMDPRNFLTENGIFQFEMLSFNEIFTVEAIESILKGSFMSKSKITYLDSEGKTVETDETYAEVIYRAGYTYDINPCYLASKILNEVGSEGSKSVSGDHTTYPGIYNFYNIGATDGTNAITRGLAWANGGADGKLKTYSRPWNSPQKSIIGGAEFLASSYIAVGQFTGYLQRFNVNPDSYYKVHTHQYMTNLSGAVSQGYTSYNSYVKQGIIDNSFVFSIPVFENMPQSTDFDSITTVDSLTQYGTVNVNGVNIRTGPSTTYAKLQSNAGTNILLSKGKSVKILGKHFVDSDYYARILQYPVWYRISFEYNSATYEGYILGDYVDIGSVTNVAKGKYDIGIFTTSMDSGTGLMTSNPAICKIIDSNTVEFVGSGEVYVSVYNSRGLFERIKFNVTDNIGSYTVSKITVEADETTVKVTVPTSEAAIGYGFYLRDSEGKLVKGEDIEKNTYTFTGLKADSEYTVFCRYVGTFGYDYGPVKAATVSTKAYVKPEVPDNLKITDASVNGYLLSWSSGKADGYRIFRYRPEIKKYEVVKDVTEKKALLDDLDSAYTCAYRVKAYNIVGGKRVYSNYSDAVWALTLPDKVTGLSCSGFTPDRIYLNWNEVKGADSYNLYLKSKTGDVLIYEGAETSYCFTDSLPDTEYSFCVIATVTDRKIYVESEPSAVLNVLTTLDCAKNFSASDVTSASYKISWTAAENAVGYNVYRLVGDEYKLVASVAENFCELTGLENSRKDFYKVSAVYDTYGLAQESELSEAFSATTLPDKVVGLKGSAYEDRVELSWTPVKNADCYNVYLKENGKYVLKKTVKTNSYVLSGLEDNTNYSVRVRAYIRSTLGTQKGLLATFSFNTMMKTVTDIKATSITDTTCVLSWSPSSEGVNRYNVYRVDETTGKRVRIAYTRGATSVTLKNLKPGYTEKLSVSAYIMKDGAVYRKAYRSGDCEVKTRLGKVVGLSGTNSAAGTVTLKWDEVENASYYRVYMYDAAKKEYVQLSAPRTTSYKVTNLEKGTKYKFKIRAIGRSGDDAYYGYYSSVLTVSVKK